MIKNLLRLAIIIMVGIMSFVVGQTVWSRVAPKQTLPAPVTIRETKPQAKRFLPDAVVSGIVEKGILQRGNENWPLSGEGVSLGKIFARDEILGFEQINPVRVKDGQRIFIDFYKNKKLDVVIGKIATIDNRYVTFVSDPTNEKYYLNPKFKFMVADPTKTFWTWGDKPEKIKPDDILEINRRSFIYIAPIFGSATGTIKVIRKGSDWLNVELGEEKIPLVINRGTIISKDKYSNLKDGVNIYVLYWFNKGNLIAHGININP
jgi:hypothetical protein